MEHQRLLFLGTPEDQSYLPYLKPLVGGKPAKVLLNEPSTLAEVYIYCRSVGITGVISTSPKYLKLLVNDLSGNTLSVKNPSIDNYQGSLFKRDGLEIVFTAPLKQLVTVPYGKHIAQRFISKLISPDTWLQCPEFNWCILDHSNIEQVFDAYKDCYALAVDIETIKDPLGIRCIGYTALFISETGEVTTHTAVLPIDSMWAVAWMRKFNWEIKSRKVFQNGKYDLAYLSMYNAVPYNYCWDTANLFHSWYSEMPKDLGFITSYLVRDSIYWKDLAETTDLHEYYKYCGLDTYGTVLSFLAATVEMPAYAWGNYLAEIQLVYACHHCEMTGIPRDLDKLKEVQAEYEGKIADKTKSLENMLGTKGFNSNSPKQVAQLLRVLGCADIAQESTDEKSLRKAAFRHPLNNRIIDTILDLRKYRKLVSTYLTVGKEHKGVILYSLNPHATDTGRLASKEHHFWCGLQLQNIPRGKAVKQTLVAPEGWRIAECDLKQAETWDTAYISGEPTMIAAVNADYDFHSMNAASFFGVPYESIYIEELHQVINKALRDLAKRVNHGANYNMGPAVLVDTMGLIKIYEAKRLLNLPKSWQPIDVATYLFNQFHVRYSRLRPVYYEGVKRDVMTTNLLVGATGWTRYCFSDPTKSKTALNAYIAHGPQSLNAQTVNKGFIKCHRELSMNEAINPRGALFKLLGQIHDSILFMFREGHEYFAEEVRKRMEIPVTVKGYDGVVRTFTVPADIKAGKDGKGALSWATTE